MGTYSGSRDNSSSFQPMYAIHPPKDTAVNGDIGRARGHVGWRDTLYETVQQAQTTPTRSLVVCEGKHTAINTKPTTYNCK